MDFKHKESDNRGSFYLENEDGIMGELTYTKQDNNILTLDHTEVEEKYKGEGIGAKLVKHSVEFARENNFKIDPLCSYAEKQFNRHKDYEDVRADT